MYSARAGTDAGWEHRRWADFSDEIQWDLWPIPQTNIGLNTESDSMRQNPGCTVQAYIPTVHTKK